MFMPVSKEGGLCVSVLAQFLPFLSPINKINGASLVTQMVKNPPEILETRVPSLGGEDPREKEMATHSIFLPGESHGQRSLVGYSPRGRKESDTTERLTSLHTCSYRYLS